VLARDVEAFAAAAGYTETGRRSELRATMTRPGRTTLRLELVPTGGRVFGGAYALEISTARPVLPHSSGLEVKGKGVVRKQGIAFRPRRADAHGAALATRLGGDDRLVEALQRVHFERIRVEPDGRPVIRHMGGSVVWMLFPPMARPIAIGDEQVRATADALEAFAEAGAAAP
jgi:hypothetical protein